MTANPLIPSPRIAVPRVLIADDQPSISDALVFLLKMRGVQADVASSPAEVLERVKQREYDLLLMDMNYEQDTTSGDEGLRLVDAVRQIDPALGMVVMTAWSTVEIAVAALQHGASDFIQKPWDNDTAARVITDQIAATAKRRQEWSITRAEREQARQVQRSLMGEASATLGPFSVAAESRSSRMVGGDFFDVKKLDDDRLLICVADVMGKGMGAALLMSNFQAQFRAIVARSGDPAQIARDLNQVLRDHMNGHLITSFIGVLDAKRMEIAFTSAGHPPALLYQGGAVDALTSDDAVLGGVEAWAYRSGSRSLRAGDRIVVVSDGFLEADCNGEELGEERLEKWLVASASADAEHLKDQLTVHLDKFCTTGLHDDATVMVVAVS